MRVAFRLILVVITSVCALSRQSVCLGLVPDAGFTPAVQYGTADGTVMSRINCNTIWMQGFPQAFDSRVVGEDVR